MPDTGAPWNIPYVAGTDLVSDWPTDSQTLAEAIADGLDAAGKIAQVVQAVKTDPFTTTSTSMVDITGLTANITPASTSNKVLVIAQLIASAPSLSYFGGVQLTRAGSPIYIGDANGSNNRVSTFVRAGATYEAFNLMSVYLDSPAADVSTTYAVQIAIQGASASGTVYVNRHNVTTTSADGFAAASSLTLIEVKG